MENNAKYISLGLYLISLAFPVFFGSDIRGFHALLLGPFAAFLPWLGNLFYFLAIFLRKRWRTEKLICIGLACACASYTFTIHEVEDQLGAEDLTKVSPGYGFLLWYGAMILWLGIQLIKRFPRARPNSQVPGPPPS